MLINWPWKHFENKFNFATTVTNTVSEQLDSTDKKNKKIKKNSFFSVKFRFNLMI